MNIYLIILMIKQNTGSTEKHINDRLKKYDKRISVKMFENNGIQTTFIKEILNFELPHDEFQAKKKI